MISDLFYQVMCDFISFCRFHRTGKRIAWTIPAHELHGNLYQAAQAIPVSRQLGRGMVKSLRRPVARNGIKLCSRRKAGVKK